MAIAAQYNDDDLEISDLVLPGGEKLSIRAPTYHEKTYDVMSIKMEYASKPDMHMDIPLQVVDECAENIMVFAFSKKLFVIVLNYDDSNSDSPLFVCRPGKCSSEFECRMLVEGGRVSAVMEHEGCLVVVTPQGRISMYDIDSDPKLMWSAVFAVAAAGSVRTKDDEVLAAARDHHIDGISGPALTELLIQAGEVQVCRSRSDYKGDLHEYIREQNVKTFIISSAGPIFDGRLAEGCYWRLADDEPGVRRVEGAMPRIKAAIPQIVCSPMKRTSCMTGKRKRREHSGEEEAIRKHGADLLTTIITSRSRYVTEQALEELELLAEVAKKREAPEGKAEERSV